MTARTLFVTGTDTGVGKTRIASALIRLLVAQGVRTVGMKPVAAGAEPGQLNEDVAVLRAAGDVDASLADINPYAFDAAIAPHIAAQQAGVTIDIEVIAAAHARLASRADVVVVEGAGGWRVPLSDTTDMADLAARLGGAVVLVVGLRLGCLNHAVLTAEAIRNRGLPWAGWVANRIDPHMTSAAENLASLHLRLPGPCLGVEPYSSELPSMSGLTLPAGLVSQNSRE
ncbi:MAG: dethiobiotin synthase [Hydrogenophilales bacterium 16-64-46]|nr:MAG: dethiobiotin synthase [Hydrogenophilales bacterium 12-64-13]OYZ07258.1 MAG: dethiobiotin synthase [Hydrogenophilales bacterium 16-64-46]OZA37275.1 MAG: dethiobiotin synthase [Hydrogenophilales bacterium 17-64-34]HQS98976.1 dethiobiotin synthase [Thiobacillus sp.]